MPVLTRKELLAESAAGAVGMTALSVIGAASARASCEYRAGDAGYVPFAMGHIENFGSESLRFLEMFRSDRFVDLSLNQWLTLTPPELAQHHLTTPNRRTMDSLSKKKRVVVR